MKHNYFLREILGSKYLLLISAVMWSPAPVCSCNSLFTQSSYTPFSIKRIKFGVTIIHLDNQRFVSTCISIKIKTSGCWCYDTGYCHCCSSNGCKQLFLFLNLLSKTPDDYYIEGCWSWWLAGLKLYKLHIGPTLYPYIPQFDNLYQRLASLILAWLVRVVISNYLHIYYRIYYILHKYVLS